MTENNIEKPKIYWAAKLAEIFLISYLALLIIAIPLNILPLKPNEFVLAIIAILATILFISSFFLALYALIKIYRSNLTLGGKNWSTGIIVSISLLLFFMGPMSTIQNYDYNPGRCGTNLGGLGKSILNYANDYNGQLPDANKWCDLLIMYEDVEPQNFICTKSDAKYGESSYALNKEIVGMKWSDIPQDMVILFETNYGKTDSGRDGFVKDREFATYKNISQNNKVYKNRWNQVGGPELLAIENHNFNGCNILFADTHVKFIKYEDLAGLRWKLNGKTDFTLLLPFYYKFKTTLKIIAFAWICLIVLATAIYILYKFPIKKRFTAIILISLLAGLAGGFFGHLSELIYTSYKLQHIGAIAGATWGIIAGICYGAILAALPFEFKQQKSFQGYAVSTGMLTGILCSTIVHILLMITRWQPMPLGIFAGIPYGVLCGAILGAISSFLFKKFNTESYTFSGEKNEL